MQRREIRAIRPVGAPAENAGGVAVPTAAQILKWPATVDLPTAGRVYGMSRNTAYGMAKDGRFPVEVLRVGSRLRVRTAAILADLGITAELASREVS